MFSFLFGQAAQMLTASLLPGSSISYLASGIGAFIGNDFEKYLLTDDRFIASGYRFGGFNQQSFCYGTDIPKVYGRVHLTGNIVWYGEVREEKNTKVREFGNIFKHKEYNLHYRYYANFAMILCEGVVDEVSRIWADGEEVFLNHHNLTTYYGTESQLIDPLIEKHLGTGNASAFRGLCYVVIKDFPIDPKRSTLPKFTFEVKRGMSNKKPFNNFTAINLGPGYGEFAYDIQIAYRKYYSKFELGIIYHDHQDQINMNASNQKSDMYVSLEHMFEQFPKLQWVTINIAWYTNSANISDALVYPTCEYREGMYSSPNDWSVATYNRSNARIAAISIHGNFIYGGTPSDCSILSLVAELKKRNIKVMICPVLLVEDDNKTWRGYIGGEDKYLDKFYNGANGYVAFMSHYANLLKDHINGFVLGSQMQRLNKSVHGKLMLKKLAQHVKNIFAHRNIIVTYGADVAEYADLSDLWSSDCIDVIGINAYLKHNAPLNFDALPPSKKIWFTQFGFPSIKDCEDFIGHGFTQTSDAFVVADFEAQEKALLNAHEQWRMNSRIEKVFLYYYDVNPNIHLPEYNDPHWPSSYALNFKSTNIGVKQIIEDLIKDFAERDSIILDLYNHSFQGAIIKGFKNYQEFFHMLSMTANYHTYEEDGKLYITNKLHSHDDTLEAYENLFCLIQQNTEYYQIHKIRVYYICQERDYNLDYVDHRPCNIGQELSIFFPFVTNNHYAIKLAVHIASKSEKYQTSIRINLPYHFYDKMQFGIYRINQLHYLLQRKAISEGGILDLDFVLF
jgi:hypothetical protein